jgi:hypothetical protein
MFKAMVEVVAIDEYHHPLAMLVPWKQFHINTFLKYLPFASS